MKEEEEDQTQTWNVRESFLGKVRSMVRPEAQVGISMVALEELKAAHCGWSMECGMG